MDWSSPARWSRRLRRLGAADRRLLVRAGLLLVRYRVMLTASSFESVRSHLATPHLSPRPVGSPSPPSPARIAWAVRTAARAVPGASCLVQALVGKRLLTGYGYRARIRLGAARGEGHDGERDLPTHAWLESDGHVLLGDSPEIRYSPFRELGPGGR